MILLSGTGTASARVHAGSNGSASSANDVAAGTLPASIWGLEVNRRTATLLTDKNARRVRKRVNTLLFAADMTAKQRTRVEGLARRFGFVVFRIPAGASAERSAECASRPNEPCVATVSSSTSATSPADAVVLRLLGPTSIKGVQSRASAAERLVLVVQLRAKPRLSRKSWVAAIRFAARQPNIDLAVSPIGKNSRRAFRQFLSVMGSLDVSPPTTPSGLALTAATGSSLSIAWKKSRDKRGVAGYGVYRGDALVSTTKQSSATLSSLACGTSYLLGVDAFDAAGNRSSPATLKVATSPCPAGGPGDRTPPTAPFGLAVTGATTSAISVTWVGSTDSVGVSGYGLYLNDVAYGETPSKNATFAGLSCGRSYRLSVDAYDAAGNRSSRTTISGSTAACPVPDTSPPTAPTNVAQAGATPTSVTLAWTASTDNDAVSGYSVYNGSALVGYGAGTSYTIAGLACGATYTFGVEAYDSAGNRSSRVAGAATAAACPTPDTAAPSVPGGAAVIAVTSTSISVSWQASSDNVGVAGYGMYRNATSAATTTATSYTLTNLACGTGYVVGIDAYDAAGNRSAPATVAAATGACDTSAPTSPSGLTRAAATGTSVGLAWGASSDNVGVTGYTVYKGSTRVADTTATSHAVGSLTCGTTYTFGVEAYDAAGNRSSRSTLTTSTNACADTSAPTAPGRFVTTGATTTSISVSWAASNDNVGVVGYTVYRGATSVGNTTARSFTLPGLNCGTSYSVGVEAYDAAGNRSSRTTMNAATAACASTDTIAPSVPQGQTITGRTQATVTMAWSAATDNIGVAGYRTYLNGTAIATTTQLTYTYSGLTCGTTYTVALEAYDAAGNASNRAQATGLASTLACGSGGDSQAPSTPAGLTVTASTENSLSLSWTPSIDNVGVSGYGRYVDGALVSSGGGTSFTFAGLTCGRAYTLGIDAVDAAGNRSARATVGGSTAACSGGTPPPDGRLYVSTSGSDANNCAQSAPCRSFQRAYQLAAPGAVVEVAGGSYPDQTLTAVAGKTGPNVVFQEAAGASVVLDGIGIEGADFVTFRGFQTSYVDANHQRGIFAGPGSTFVTFENIDAGSVGSWFAEHLTVLGGDYGPCYSPPADCSNNKIDVSRNVLIDGATFHDLLANPGDHWECMYVNGSDRFTIRNSRFRGCAIFDLFVTISGSDARAMGHRNVLIENNWFESAWTEDGPVRGWSALSLAWCQNAPQPAYRDVTIRNNSFQNGAGIERDMNASGAGCVFQNVRVTGNLAAYAGCQSGFIYDYNVWSGGSVCSSTDRSVANFPYVNNAHGAGQDYHLSGAGVFDDLIPAALCPSHDTDGQSRPLGPACDAGSDER